MKLKLNVNDLKSGFKNLATAMQSGSKSVGSILGNVDYSYIRFSAYDNNSVLFECAREGIFARSLHKAEVMEPGVIFIPCSYLYGLSYPSSELLMETEGNNVHLVSGSMDVQLNGIINQNALTINPVEEIPHTLTIPMGSFASARHRVGFPQQHTGSGKRPLIRHICQNGMFGSQANDKYSLALFEIPKPDVADFDFVFPTGFEDGLLAIFGKEEQVWVGYTDKAIRFTSTNFDVQFPRIQESKPFTLVKDVKSQIAKILSTEQLAQFDFSAKDALRAANTVASLQYTARAKQFRILLKVEEDRVRVTTSTSFGKGDNSFAAEVVKGVGTEISCHSSILQTFLSLMSNSGVHKNTWHYSPRQINTLVNEACTYMFTSV